MTSYFMRKKYLHVKNKDSAWFQASAEKQMRTVLFRVIMQKVSNFLPTFWENLLVPPWFFTPEEGTNRLFQNIGKNYHYSLCNNPEKQSSQCFVTIPQSAVHNYLLLWFHCCHHYKDYGGDKNTFISYVWLIHLSKGLQCDSNSEYIQTYLSASLPFRSTQGWRSCIYWFPWREMFKMWRIPSRNLAFSTAAM